MNHPLQIYLLIAAIHLQLPTPSSSLTVTIDPSIKYQHFEGWGTSLCWWAVQAGKWNEKNREALIGAIVDPDTGLGYNCFRYNIGGGDQPGHSHLSEARAVPGFKPSENGLYDWTADQNQRNILLGIASRGTNQIFEAFSNSPPWWMTVSGCVSGNSNGADNLKPAYFPAFAEYLTTIVKQYRDTWGITFRTIEPFNEPSSGYWKTNGGQEGCGFKNRQSQMVKELGKQLVAKGLYPQTSVSAADETSLEHTITALRSYDDSAFSFLSQINSHSYSGWKFRKAVDSLAKARGKILWQSESGPLEKGTDPSDITMWMSHVIIQDLRVMKANAWIDWQVGDPVGDWMTIQLDHTRQTFKYTKRYYLNFAPTLHQ
jgi:O-glycosyl hydrolase